MTAALSAATIVTLASLLGTALSASTSAPQLRRLHRTHNVAGISASTSALTIVSGLSWSCYAWAAHLPLLVVSSACAVLVQVPILTMLARAGSWPLQRRLLAGGLLALYAAIAVLLGWTALGIALTVHALIQYAPQVIAVLRSDDVTGVSPVSARMMLANGLTWGVAGVFADAVPLMAWSVIVSSAATVILVRISGGITIRGHLPHYRWS